MIIIGVMRECLDRHIVTGFHREDRLERAAEMAPMDRIRCNGQIMVSRAALYGHRRNSPYLTSIIGIAKVICLFRLFGLNHLILRRRGPPALQHFGF